MAEPFELVRGIEIDESHTNDGGSPELAFGAQERVRVDSGYSRS